MRVSCLLTALCDLSPQVYPEPSLEALNNVISAELRTDLTLQMVVSGTNMHTRDHLTRPGSRCDRNSRYQYGFLQPITNQTTIDGEGRVHFRRRNRRLGRPV